MSVQEFIDKLRLLAERIQEEMPRIMDLVANDGIALIKRRLETEGIEGASYSDSYREFRIKKGRPVNVVNLSFMNQMLNNLQVIEKTVTSGEYRSGVGNSRQNEADKMEYNILRYGDKFLEFTDEEAEWLNEIGREEILKIINEVGL